MRFRLLILALLVSPALAQYGVGNFGTAVPTTGPLAKCSNLSTSSGIETITPATPTTGQATVVTVNPFANVSCANVTISFTNTAWDSSSGYPFVSHTNTGPDNTVVTSSISSPTYDSASWPNGYYAANGVMFKDTGGTLWNFYKSCAQSEIGSACVAGRNSTNHGATWSTESKLFLDPTGTSCSGGPCAYSNIEAGYIPGGNLSIIYNIYTPVTVVRQTSQSSTCNPTSVDCTNPSNWSTPANISLVPAGESAGFFFCVEYGTMANLPGGALGAVVSGGVSCASNHIYLLISCDGGATWGTGTGCVGLMAQYASTPYRRITTPSGGYVVDPLEQEMEIAYIGGTTLYGLARNGEWTSGCSAPCGQLIQWVSNDLGATWSNALTNLGGYAPPTGFSAVNYTEVSPVIYNPGLGGLWIVAWGDRGQDSQPFNYTQNLLVMVNPANMLTNPTNYPSVPTQFSYNPGQNLGGYPAITLTGGSNFQILLQYDGVSPRVGAALAVWQLTANPTLTNTLSMRGKSARGVPMR